MELNVVPAFSVRVSPGLAVIPAARSSDGAYQLLANPLSLGKTPAAPVKIGSR